MHKEWNVTEQLQINFMKELLAEETWKFRKTDLRFKGKLRLHDDKNKNKQPSPRKLLDQFYYLTTCRICERQLYV